MFFKLTRIRDLKYLRTLANMPCVISGNYSADVVGHHLLDLKDKSMRGAGMKAPDNCVLPMSFHHHTKLHAMGDETKYFAQYGIYNAEELAKRVYDLYANQEYASMKTLLLTKEL